jgi:hypothetical protein
MNTDFSVLMTTGKDPQKESEKNKIIQRPIKINGIRSKTTYCTH